MASDRRTLIADATIVTIAREGMRGLTHRAVDRTTGLPEGSTSYYFRTRESLLFAALARMAELDTADIGDLPNLGGLADLDELTTLVTAVVQRWLTVGRERTLARYELTLEATRRPELHAKMVEYGSGFRVMAELMLTAAGASEPRRRGHALVAYLDGLMYHQLAGVGAGDLSDADLWAACRDMLAMALQR
ncbi:MAG: TetR family transcriptional regulator [Actinophytocola sp.]|uniref:TetR/AcrR family transcriptional regulator n=1 Tax=Actinophytocola sp. TaxID=1872138 RepID=UPI00132876E0|nr:TetR/AcrR family transcriptional regulator [Actinophytocola sp.]MPZ84156.1 TetR family transcriptional regulator [Actinophytocola sp.]